MSIYGTIPGLGDLGDDETIGPPWRYRGSHILPDEDDPRGGHIGLAHIPSHITRDARDDQPDDGTPWPWLRLSLDGCDDDPAVILNPAQARHLADLLARWADTTGGTRTAPVPDVHPDLTGLPAAADVETAHAADTRTRRLEGRIAQLEAQLVAAHSDLNRILTDADDSAFGDGIRHTAHRLRPHLHTPNVEQPKEQP